MANFREDWRALSARVRALGQASTLHAQYMQASSEDQYVSYREIGAACANISTHIPILLAQYPTEVSPDVRKLILSFSSQRGETLQAAGNNAAASRAAIVMLLAFVAEVDFLLHDRQAQIRSRTERAFLHLQRLIATNEREQTVWLDAFDRGGEIKCEALGGTHLLWHGIFAFKVDAVGARTDLVFGGAIDEVEARNASEGLVLTEWKKVSEKDAREKFGAAKRQADLYKMGALATLELTTTRYLVAVSKKKLPTGVMPADFGEGEIWYRHLNLVLEPETPSKAALKA